jgi:hypothetical protein
MIPAALDAVLVPTITSLLALTRPDAERMATMLRESDQTAEVPPDLRAQLMCSARTRLANRALKAESRKSDRNGGFKSVYFDGCEVISIGRTQRCAQMRQGVIEFLMQHAMYRNGYNVPQMCLTIVRVASTPVIGMYQIISHSERMTCTLAEFLHASAYNAQREEERVRSCVIMLSCVCYGLHKINTEMSIRHGDLKPDNVMLRGRQDDANNTNGILRRWCLIDFGLMKDCRSSCGDIFFLCWWLVHSYTRHIPPRVLSTLRRALCVPYAAMSAVQNATTYVPNGRGNVEFAKTVRRVDPSAVVSDADAQWRKQYGLTKVELYQVQRALEAPTLEPAVFVKKVHKLFHAVAS